MAISNQQLQILINARDEASRVLERIGRNFSDIAEVSKKAGVAITATAVIIGGTAIKAASDFESALSNVNTLFDDNGESVKELGDGIKELLKTIPKDANDLGASAYSIVSAGIGDASEALNVLEQSGKLAVGGLATTAEATDLLTTALKAFGKDADEADSVANILFKTVKAGKTDVSQLAIAFGKMAGNASAAGISLEDAQAATAALTTVTGKTSESQNALAQVFLELTVAGGKLDKALQENGIGLIELNEAIGTYGLVGGFEQARDMMGLTNTEFKNLFSSAEGGTAVFQLLQSANIAYKDTLESLNDPLNALNTAFAKQQETIANQYQILKNNLNLAMIELGTKIIPILLPLIDKLSNIIGSVNPVILQFGLMVSAIIGPALIIIGFLPTLTAGISAFGAVLAFVAANPIVLIIGAIVALGVAIVALIKNWDNVKIALQEFWDKLLGFFGFLGENGYIVDLFRNSWENIVTVFNTTLLPSLKKLWVAIQDFFKALQPVIPVIKILAQIAGGELLIALLAVVKVLEVSLIVAMKILETLIYGVTNAINIMAAGWNSFKNTIQGVIDTVSNLINKLKSLKAVQAASAVVNKISGERATGGSVTGGNSYIVGENGPEVFTPGATGFITPNNKLGGSSVIINITGNTLLDDSVAEKIGDMMLDNVKANLRI